MMMITTMMLMMKPMMMTLVTDRDGDVCGDDADVVENGDADADDGFCK